MTAIPSNVRAQRHRGIIARPWPFSDGNTRHGSIHAERAPKLPPIADEGIPPSLHLLCYDEAGDLAAVQAADPLTNAELEAVMDEQRRLGRSVEFELIW